MSHITIDVELLAGTDIENAIKEASMLAKTLMLLIFALILMELIYLLVKIQM